MEVTHPPTPLPTPLPTPSPPPTTPPPHPRVPAGNNQLTSLDGVTYLRRLPKLRMLNLAGNPMSKEPDYKSYVLSHVKDLVYLDYRRVTKDAQAAAIEAHQVGGWGGRAGARRQPLMHR